MAFANVGFVSLGLVLTQALGLLGQVLSALVIDHFGWLGSPIRRFDGGRAASLVPIVAGIALMALS